MYLENLSKGKREELRDSGVFRIARIHPNGKTWLSSLQYATEYETAAKIRDNANTRLDRWGSDVSDGGSRYFVWPTDPVPELP